MKYFFLGFGGFKNWEFPGVSLLSLSYLSDFPVDLAILFGPGLSAIVFNIYDCYCHMSIRKILNKTHLGKQAGSN